MGFHACPNKRGMEDVQKRLAAGEKNPLPTGDDRGGVTGGIVRDAKRTLLQVERTKGGQMVCDLNPEDLKLPGVDIAVKPGPKGEIDHTHGDGQPHDHGDGQPHDHGDDEWIEKAVNGRKLAKAYDECPKWSTLAVHLIVELHREFVNLHGGYFPARAAAGIIMNLAAANYESQIGVEFKLEYHVAKGPLTYIGHQYASSDAYALLQEFRTRWESGWLAFRRRGAVHLLTGKQLTWNEVPGSSVIGIAYNDVMCDSIKGDAKNGKYEYGISVATQPSLGCNVGLVMSELGNNAGSQGNFLGCSHTFHPLAIGQIEDHMDGHVPNDGWTDGCRCEKMFNFGNRPWWWKFPWAYWGPFKPADLPELDLPPVYELPPNEIPPKEIPGLDVKPLPEEPLPKDPQLEKDPLSEKEPNVPIDPRGPRTTAPIPPPKRKGPDVAGEVVCQSVMRRRRCNKAPGCEWEGPRKAKQGGRCVASSGASDVVPETPDLPGKPDKPADVDMCSNLRPRQCRRARQCRFDRPSRTCVPK